MDAMCPTNRPVGAPRSPSAGVAPLRPGAVPKGAGRPMPKGVGKGTVGGGANSVACYCYRCGKWGHRSATCRV
eukprot:10312848-Heterocapsa_arctica.AAC.1